MGDSFPTDPDKLLRLAREGDHDGLGQLFGAYRNYLKMLARLQIHSELRTKADASDIVQDTLMEAHRGFQAFRGTTEAELLQWLRGILATRLANLTPRFYGTKQRDLRLDVVWTMIWIDRHRWYAVLPFRRRRRVRRRSAGSRLWCWPMCWPDCRSTITRSLCCGILSN